MHPIRKRYFPALAEYIRSGSEASLFEATEIGKLLHGIHPEDIIAIHEESMQMLVANVESEEAIKSLQPIIYFPYRINGSFSLSASAGPYTRAAV